MRLAVAVVALAALAVPAPALGRSGVVASLPGDVRAMSAWNGHVVFSLGLSDGRWALMRATEQGIERLRVAPQNAPFDADAGTDAKGRPVAVFSRCPQRGSTAYSTASLAGSARCRLHLIRLDVPGARPRVIRALRSRRYSDGAPTIWRGRVAFGRVLDRGTLAAIFIQQRPGSRRLLRLGRGTIPSCPAGGPRRCFRVAVPRSLDLGPSRLAIVWSLAGGNAFPQEDEELWVERPDGAAGRLLDVGGAGECAFGGRYSFRNFAHPTILRDRVSYLAYRGDCWLADSAFTVSGPDAATRRERESRSANRPRTIAYDAARDATGWWWVRGLRVARARDDGSVDQPCRRGACELVHSDRLALRRVKVSPRPRPPVERRR